MRSFLSGRRGLRVVDCATAVNQCSHVALAPTPTGPVARTGVEASESRIYRESADIEAGFPCHKELQSSEADQISEQSSDVIVRAVGSIKPYFSLMHLDAEMAEAGPAIKSFTVRGRVIDRDVILERAARVHLERCAVFAMVLYLRDQVFKRVEDLAVRILLPKNTIRIAAPIAVVASLLYCANLGWKIFEDALRAAM